MKFLKGYSRRRLLAVISRALVGTLVVYAIAFVVYFVALDQIFSAAVPRAKELGFAPLKKAAPAEPEVQVETHTCGLHAMNSIYAAHGLVPEDHALRLRLGVDRPAVPNLKSTLGSLQADLCRVLAQDAFNVDVLDLESPTTLRLLDAHLARSWKALTLIRKDNGNFHWVVLQSSETPGNVEIVDSQRGEPYVEKSFRYLNEKVVTAILVTPHPTTSRAIIQRAHREGVRAMRLSAKRIKVLESRADNVSE